MKKFYIFTVMCLAVMFGFVPKGQAQTAWDGTADISWYDASQTSFDISTPEQLAGIGSLLSSGTNFSGKTIRLTADIWLNSTGDSTNNWAPLGANPTATGEDTGPYYAFSGTFSGGGHIIYNMYVEKPNYFQAGLFGVVGGSAHIDSLVMVNPVVKSRGMMGSIVGFADGSSTPTISNCLVINTRIEGSTSSGSNNIGGIIGATWKNGNSGYVTTVTNCGVTGSIKGYYVGGIGGNSTKLYPTNCYFAGTINCLGNSHGGVLGYCTSTNLNITNSYSNVSGTSGEGRSGTVMTDADMQTQAFVDNLGPAFKLDNGVNNGYPVMSYMAGVDPVAAEICSGESITLTAFGYDSYLWSNGSTSESITVSPTATTTYTVTGTSNGVSSVNTSVITVHPQADITVTAMASPDGQTHGTVTPTTTSVPCGSSDNVTITITPDANWHIALITLNGETLRGEDPNDGPVVSYTFNPGGTLADVKVFFSNIWPITTTTLMDNGSPLNVSGLVTPWGTNGVYNAIQGDSVVYHFNETAIYHVTDVTIDDVSQGIITEYTFYDVAAPHTISVTYGACGPVTNLTVSQVMGTSALVSWGAPSVGTLVDYTLEYKEANDADWTTVNALTSTQYMLSNLIPQGAYQVRVKTTCDNTLEGGWETKSFNTPCLVGGDVQIGEGTGTTSYLPSYNLYNYSLTEQVFTAAELGGPNTFRSISFQASSVNASTRNWSIYLMPTTATSLSSFVNVDSTAQLVFSGTANISQGWFTIHFDSAYVYDGTTNLMLVVDDNTGSWVSSNYYYYTNNPNGNSVRIYSDGTNYDPFNATSYSATTHNYRNNVIFGGDCDSLVTCVAPNIMITGITDDGAEVQWVPGYMENSWNMEYKLDSDTDWIPVGTVTGDSYVFSGLNPNTKYNVRMQSDCGGETSEWTTQSFRTDCGPILQLPYSENFEDVSAIYSTSQDNYYLCWNRYASDPAHYVYIPSNTYAHSGSHFLDFHHTNNCYNIAIMPAVDPSISINTLMVDFWACKSGTSGTLEVGIMTDPADASTFEPVDTIDLSAANTYQYVEQFVKFENYAGSGNYIAFRVSNAVSCGYYIDDVVIDYSPECSEITSLEVAETTGTSALISWTDGPFGTVNSYTLEYSEAGQENWVTVGNLDTTVYLLGNLEPSSYYDVRVMVNCDGSLSSDWVTITFHTECLVGGDVVIGDGTTANSYLPSYSFYNYSYTQQLFLASEIGGPKTIESVTFDMSNYSVNRTYKIYMMHTTATSGADWIPATTAQLVFDAPQQLVSGLNTFEFSTPFEYNGSDNLLLIVLDMTGSWSSGNTWRTHTAPFTASRYVYQDASAYSTGSTPSSGSNGSTSERNNVIFGAGCDTTVNCVAPHISVASVDQTSATINWVAGYQESSWEMEYRPLSDTNWTSMGTVTSMSEVISGLTPNTTYKVRMRSDCGDEYSYWTETSFTTACGAITITATTPWTENFEGYTGSGAKPFVCWDTPVTEVVDNGTSPFVYCGHGPACHSGANSAEMKGNNNMLALPEFTNDIHDLRLSFWATTTNTSNYGTMEVGVITDIDDPTTFVALGPAGVPSSRNGVGNYMGPFDFNGMAVTTGRIAIRFIGTSGLSWNLDDFTVELTPDCPSPVKTSVTASNVDAHNATITFTDNDPSHNSWTVYYKPAADSVWNTIITSDTTTVLSNLDPETTYDVYVVTNCTTSDPVEDATLTIHFTTGVACPAPTGITVSNIGMTTATISWQGNADSYTITYGSDVTTSTTNSVDLTGLTAGTSYTVSIVSDCGAEGTSSATTYTFSTALCDLADQCNYTISVTGAYGDSWDYNTLSVQQNGIEVASIHNIGSTSATVSLALCSGVSTSLVFTTIYYADECSVTLIGPDGTQVFSQSDMSTYTTYTFTSDCTMPTCPSTSMPTVSNIGMTTVTVDWTAGGTETNWNVEYKTATDANWTVVPVTSHPYTLTGLTNMTAYQLRVQADCGAGDVSTYKETTFTTANCEAADQCEYTFVLVDDYGDGWNDGSLTVQQGGITIAVLEATNHMLSNTQTYDTVTLYLCDNLSTSLLWTAGSFDDEISVYLYGPDGSLEFSHVDFDTYTTHTFTTDCGGSGPATCDVPTGLAVNNPGQTTATATWTAGGTETSWNVQYKAATASTWQSATANTTSYTMTGLTPATNYQVRVQAVCDASSTSEWTTAVSFTTASEDTPTCPAPTGLTATVDHTDVTLIWQQEPNTATEWQINYRLATESNWSTVTATSTTYTLTDLTANAQYVANVVAHCTNGLTSDESNTVTFETNNIGVEDYLNKAVTLYPNPATEMVSVAVSDANIMITGVEIYNVYGQLINTIVSTENPLRINVSGLADGMYYVRVTTDNGVVTKNFVKR